jgi:hypothetical protein
MYLLFLNSTLVNAEVWPVDRLERPDDFAGRNEPIKHRMLGKPRRATIAAPKSPALAFFGRDQSRFVPWLNIGRDYCETLSIFPQAIGKVTCAGISSRDATVAGSLVAGKMP